MKIKKILIIILFLICVTGCVKVSDLTYDEILNNFSISPNGANTYRRGYKYFVPKGVALVDAGPNYAIFEDNITSYYMYIDLINYVNKANIIINNTDDNIYYRTFNNDNKSGYIAIKKDENDKYMIEIMYNYAKIELMVDIDNVNNALINSINILKSIVYDDRVIETMLRDDNLTYTEENYNMFDKSNKKSSVLNYTEDEEVVVEDKIKDTDLIN